MVSAVCDVYRREDPRPLGRAWCNVFGTHYEDELYVVHAETRGKAQSIIAGELGVEFLEARIRRLPAMDDLPITAWNLLVTDSCGWVECAGCQRHIYPDGPYAYDDNGDETDAVQGPYGTAYCSAVCVEHARSQKEAA